MKYKSVFISDCHLFSKSADPQKLFDFLKNNEFDTLVIVGDFIDLWQLKPRKLRPCPESIERRKFWMSNSKHYDDLHIKTIRRILKKAQKGCKVLYVPGNHDDYFRTFNGFSLFGIEVVDDFIHTTVSGNRYFVTHGDKFDLIVKHHRVLALFGSILYDHLVCVNRLLNKFKRKKWSFSRFIKNKFKQAANFINNFEEELIDVAHKKKVDGVICGHIHYPIIKEVNGLKYCNCGDWVEHMSAIVEDLDGNLRLVESVNS